MGMTRKTVLYALVVAVLTGSMAVAALADDHGMNMYGPADSSASTLSVLYRLYELKPLAFQGE